MLLYWLTKLEAIGVRDVIINAYYLKEMIEEFVIKERENFPSLSIHLSIEKEVLGTGGGLYNAKNRLNRTFFVINSDIYTDLSLDALRKAHFIKNSLATFGVLDSPYKATVSVGEEGRIIGFRENEPLSGEKAKLLGTGIMILEPRVLDNLPLGRSDIIDTLKAEIQRGELLTAYKPDDPQPFWVDMGTPQDYFRLNHILAKGRHFLDKGANIQGETSGFLVAEKGAVTMKGSVVTDSILWNGAYVEKGAKLSGMIVAGRVKSGVRLSGGVVSGV
jgi:mannose-1-phosphate guanylyltransferase